MRCTYLAFALGAACAAGDATCASGGCPDVDDSMLQLKSRTSICAGQESGCDPKPEKPTMYPPIAKHKRILVVGAGPSGIHMASKLKYLGYSHVTVLEKTDRVGGKSFTLYRNPRTMEECTQQEDQDGVVDTVNCVAMETGTCFLHNGYGHIRHLLHHYGLKADIPMQKSGAEVPGLGIVDMGTYLGAGVTALLQQGALSPPLQIFRDPLEAGKQFQSGNRAVIGLAVSHLMSKALYEYAAIYDKLFGQVPFTMPRRPTPETLRYMNTTMKGFLVMNGLTALIPYAMIAQTAQGYGKLETIPAYYGLVWMKPEMVMPYTIAMAPADEAQALLTESSWSDFQMWKANGLARTSWGAEQGSYHKAFSIWNTGMLPEGFGKLWLRMHEKDDLNVHFNVDITEIRRLDDSANPIQVRYTENGHDRSGSYDILIYTAPHALANQTMELTGKEQAIFNELDFYVLMTTFYQGAPVPGHSDASNRSITYRPSVVTPAADGEYHADRNDFLIHGGSAFNQAEANPQLRGGIQFYETPCRDSSALCATKDHFPMSEQRFKSWQLPDELKKITDFDAAMIPASAEQFPWPYFWHFNQAAIQDGKPWDLVEMQGEKNTFWIGASASFESVHDVVNYNLQILDNHFGAEFHGDREQFYESAR